MRYLILPVAAAVTLAAVPAQDRFDVRRFLPTGYQNVVHVDLALLRDSGVWDELNTGFLKTAFEQAPAQMGWSLDDLDRITFVPMAAPSDEDGGPASPPQLSVVIFEGNAALDVPNDVLDDDQYVDDKVGAFAIRRSEHEWRDDLFLRPRPNVQVRGSTALLRPMLEAESHAGSPGPDILSLLSSRQKGLIFYFVMNVADTALNEEALTTMFPDAEWPADDRPQFMLIRASAIGDPDDPHVEVEVVFRHPKDGEGLAETERAIDAMIQKGLETPQLRMVAPLLRSGKKSRDRSDLSIVWDLGRARTAAGNISTIVLPLFMLGTAEAMPAAEEIEAVEEPPPPPPPEKKGAGNKKKAGGGK